jgi:signal transduction histidine kinase
MAAVAAILMVSCAWLEGGLAAPGIMWFPIVPMVALLVGGRRVGTLWAAIMVGFLVAFFAVERLGISTPVFFAAADPRLDVLRLSLAVGAVILFLALAALFESLKAQALSSLEAANTALADALEQAKAATRAKSDFLATMSHEIRTPLHGVFGMTEIAREAEDREQARECIDRARACAQTLLTIINDILDFSRIDAGKLALEHIAFDPRELVDGVLDTLAIEAGRKGLDLVGCVEPEVPARLMGDPGRVRQILTNLAGNAVKFTDHGEVVIALAAASAIDDPSAVVLRGTVRDTGIGIPLAAQASIFEAFTQADNSTTRRYGGTGLGLAITQRLLGLMGGSLALESAPARGSTVRFEIPLPVAEPPAPLVRPFAPGTRVLVIADEKATRLHLLHTLRRLGAEPDGIGRREAMTRTDVPALIVAELAGSDPDAAVLKHRLRVSASERPRIMGLAPIGHPAITGEAARDLAATVTTPLRSAALAAALAVLADEPAAEPAGIQAAAS